MDEIDKAIAYLCGATAAPTKEGDTREQRLWSVYDRIVMLKAHMQTARDALNKPPQDY